MHPRERIAFRSQALKEAGIWREPLDEGSIEKVEAGWVDARSNDYLGFAAGEVPRETRPLRMGAGASRLISGTWPEHLALERELADWLGTEASLVFSSGYAANVGVVSALAGPGELVLSDALNHASIIDGCRLSRAQVVVLPHRSLEGLERALADSQGVRWVVTESYFGMDGDSPDLAAMSRLCERHGAALVVDEAHALGVFGPEGRGLCAAQGVVPAVLVGGMGKALGIQGGFAACSRLYRDWLWNRARSLVFSTAPSPLSCALARERVQRVRGADAERARLRHLEGLLVGALQARGVPLEVHRHGPLFPIVLGSEAAVLEGAAKARQHGVLCHPVRPPTVPRGKSRLRVTLRADLSDSDVERLAVALGAAWSVRSEELDRESSSQLRGAPGADQDRTGARAQVPGTLQPEPPRGGIGATPLAQGARHVAGGGAAALRHGPKLELAAGARTAPSGGGPWLILGTGTGVGKTFVARAMVRELAARGRAVAGLKPIETGLGPSRAGSDAAELEGLSTLTALPSPHPLYGYPEPVTPARAARARGEAIDPARVAAWIRSAASTQGGPASVVVESAGGVFSPLGDGLTNLDLASAVEASIWVLVAPNRLGVLHDLSSTLRAMAASARLPDWIVLSAPELPDASTASNAEELARLFPTPILAVPRNDPSPLRVLLDAPSEATELDGSS